MSVKQCTRWLFAAFIISACSIPARAWIFQEVPDKAVSVHYRLAVAAGVSTNTVLVDLSNTTSWPHKETRELNIDAIKLDIDKVAASSGTVQIGVVNFINSSTGSVTWVWSREFAKNVSNTNVAQFNSFQPCFLKLRVDPAATPDTVGITPYVLSSNLTSNSTIFQNDVKLPNPTGTDAAPGAGDIILQVVNSDGTAGITVTVDLVYHSNN